MAHRHNQEAQIISLATGERNFQVRSGLNPAKLLANDARFSETEQARLLLYGMSKGAVAALTRGLARDLGPRGITVNVIQPGPTETEMNLDENVRALTRPMIAIGRMGKDTEQATSRTFEKKWYHSLWLV